LFLKIFLSVASHFKAIILYASPYSGYFSKEYYALMSGYDVDQNNFFDPQKVISFDAELYLRLAKRFYDVLMRQGGFEKVDAIGTLCRIKVYDKLDLFNKKDNKYLRSFKKKYRL